MTDAATKISALHAAYCKATGFNLPLGMDREAAWYEWVRKGFTPDDVVALVRHHKSLAHRGASGRSLKFRSLVVNVDWAEEDLIELKSRGRGPVPQPNRESILRQTGRGPAETMPPAGETAAPAKEIVDRFLAGLKEAVK